MFQLAGLFVLGAQIMRIVGAFVVIAEIGFGVYLVLNNAMMQGATWIVGAATCGWIGNIVLNLLILLGSAAAGPFARR